VPGSPQSPPGNPRKIIWLQGTKSEPSVHLWCPPSPTPWPWTAVNASQSILGVRLQAGSGEPEDLDLEFSSVFRIGRDPACEVQLKSPLVSRVHAEVWPSSGSWWVRDLGSTNRLILNGEGVDRGELKDGDTLQLGKGAPTLQLSLRDTPGTEARGRSATDHPPARVGPEDDPETAKGSTVRMKDPGGGAVPGVTRAQREPKAEAGMSLSEIEEKYLNPESDQPAGQRTQFIRMAYAQVQKREKRRTRLILGIVGALLLISAGYGLYQSQRIRRIESQAAELFQLMKRYEVQLVGLRQQAEESGSPELLAQVSSIETTRQAYVENYEAFVRDRGLYRRLKTDEERLIYETARVFGESEFEISSSFIAAVSESIHGYWLVGRGRARLLEALERAEANGYAERISAALQRHGVPPEFFYLALQESDFNARAVGPETRWGRAKGMWQFIPATAERYGLETGSLTATTERDPNDQRLDFELATDAAARYLRDLHGILTQASGLLVMASYNWGEHRVQPRLENLPEPRDVFREEFAGVPEDPASRNYWRFLTEYEDKMPEETKDYVIKIFSAAVIGRDPRAFGLEMENPLGFLGN